MMMQILAAGGIPVLTDNVRRPDEDNPRGYFEFEPVKKADSDTSWVDNADGKAVKMVYRLLYEMPPGHTYRVIFMLRDLDEVIASQDVMLDRNGKAIAAVDEKSLAAMYRRQLQEARKWLQEQPNFSVHYVDYHEVLSDSDRVVREINEFLGGDLDTAAMLRIPDESLYRQRRGAPKAAESNA
jgi:hypothetical protein